MARSRNNANGKKAPDKCREWCFTVYEGDTGIPAWDRVTHLQALFDAQKPKIVALAAGKEICPDTQRPHLQCWIHFKDSRAFEPTRNLIPWASNLKQRYGQADDPRNGSAWRAYKYCLKGNQSKDEWDSQHENGPTYGKDFEGLVLGDVPKAPAKKGKRNDLLTVKRLLSSGLEFDEVCDMDQHFATCTRYRTSLEKFAASKSKHYEHHHVRGLWIHGLSDVGKSHVVRELIDPTGEERFIKEHNKWFDGYSKQKWIIMDDVSALPRFDFEKLKNWADKYGLHVQVKNAKVFLRHKGLVVTSNYTIEEVCEGIDKKRGYPDEVLRQALVRRFTQLEMTHDNKDWIRERILEWKAFQDCSEEDQAAHVEYEKNWFTKIEPELNAKLKVMKCPLEDRKNQMRALFEIDQAEGERKEELQAAFDRVAATWTLPVYVARNDGVVMPKLKRLPGVPRAITLSDSTQDDDDFGDGSTAGTTSESEPADGESLGTSSKRSLEEDEEDDMSSGSSKRSRSSE